MHGRVAGKVRLIMHAMITVKLFSYRVLGDNFREKKSQYNRFTSIFLKFY